MTEQETQILTTVSETGKITPEFVSFIKNLVDRIEALEKVAKANQPRPWRKTPVF